MKSADYWKPAVYTVIGILVGLGWVYWSCMEEEQVYSMVLPGWMFAFKSMGLAIGALLLLAVTSLIPLQRKLRDQLVSCSLLLIVLASIGLLCGLGFVLLICLACAWEHELWAQRAMIGWLVVICSVVYGIATIRFAPQD